MLSSRKNDLDLSKRDNRSRSPYSPSFKQRKRASNSPPKHRHLGPRERDSARNDDRRYKNQDNHLIFRGKHAGKDEGPRSSQKRSNSSLKHGQKAEYSHYTAHDGGGSSHRGSPPPKRPRTLPPAPPVTNSSSKKKAACSNHHRSSKVTVDGNKASSVKKEAKVKSPKSTEPLFSPLKSLKPYLEDIDSDEDLEPTTDAASTPTPEEDKGKTVDSSVKMAEEQRVGPLREGDGRKLSKEELYLLMEQLDTDITMTEQRLEIAKDKQAVYEGSDYVYHLPTRAAFMAINDEKCHNVECAIKASAVHEAIYRENRLCVSQAQATAPSEVKPLLTNPEPLYRQPCEAPGYSDVMEQHRWIRPLLLQHLVQRRKEQHKLEVELQQRYDDLSEQWEKKMEQAEQHPRKKTKDQKNRELFEKLFPELKRIKEPSEKINRIDARGINIVRSDAEFHELMDALNEQAESKDRHRRCHAAIPAMALHPEEKGVRFININGLLANPLRVHSQQGEACLVAWSEEEKLTFKRVYALHPKSFERIAKFLPKKTVQQCVQFYYLTKKKEKYKVLVNAVREERKRRGLPRGAHDSPTTPVGPLLAADSKGVRIENVALPGPTRRPTLLKPKTQSVGDWSDVEIQQLREGMRTHGRMWSKVSRYVGTNKTAGHCKSFFQEYQSNQQLQLGQALEEHVRRKNLGRMMSKEETKLQPPPPSKGSVRSRLGSLPTKQEEVSVDAEDDGEAALQSESGSESDGSSTCTAGSSEEEEESGSEQEEEVVHKRNLNPRRMQFSSVSHRFSEDSLDVLFSAAEIVEGAVPGDLALHDHTYALPHDILYHNMDMSATSGLSLIAAAAAVVSPTLSSSSGASPLLAPVKAPRGRPPNSSKRSSLNQRLQPSYLSPAGPGLQVPLTDQRMAGLRGRSRSTGANVRSPMQQQQLSPTTTPLSKMQTAKCTLAPTKPKPATPSSLPMGGQPSPGGVASAPVTPSSPGSAFEALVNVAAAAPPAEMPSTGGGAEGKSIKPPMLSPKAVMPAMQPHPSTGLPHLKPAIPGGTPPEGRSPPFQYGFFLPPGSYPPSSNSGSAQPWVPHSPWSFQVFGNGGVIYSASSGSLMYPHQPNYPTHIPMMHTFHGGYPPRAPPPQGQFASGMMPNSSVMPAGSTFGLAPPAARAVGQQQHEGSLSSGYLGNPTTSTAANPHSVANLLGSSSAATGTDTGLSPGVKQEPCQSKDSSSACPDATPLPASGEGVHPLHLPVPPPFRQLKTESDDGLSVTNSTGDDDMELVNHRTQSQVEEDKEASKGPTPETSEEKEYAPAMEGEGPAGSVVAERSAISTELRRDTPLLCPPAVLLADDSNGSDDQLNDLGTMDSLSNLFNHSSSVSDLEPDGSTVDVDDDLANSGSFGSILPTVNLDPSTCTLPPTSLQFNPERFSPNMAAMSLFSSVSEGSSSKEPCESPSTSPTPRTTGDKMSLNTISDQGHNGSSS